MIPLGPVLSSVSENISNFTSTKTNFIQLLRWEKCGSTFSSTTMDDKHYQPLESIRPVIKVVISASVNIYYFEKSNSCQSVRNFSCDVI
jgi:hypothetical protein